MGRMLLAVLALVATEHGFAQQFDATRLTSPTDLGRVRWNFQQGDDPAWSRADFDDTGWKVIDPQQALKTYATVQPNGIYWYRLRLRVPQQGNLLGIQTGSIARAFQIFANGQLLSRAGGFPPHAWQAFVPDSVYRLPTPIPSPGILDEDTVVLAIRCVLLGQATTLSKPLLADEKLTLGRYAELDAKHRFDVLTYDVRAWGLCLLAMMVGIIAFGLYTRQREQKDYRWIAAWAILQIAGTLFSINLRQFEVVERTSFNIASSFLDGLRIIVYLGLYASMIRRRPDVWSQLAKFAICGVCLAEIWVRLFARGGVSTVIPSVFYTAVLGVTTAWPLVSLAKAWRRGNRDAGLMLIPYCCMVLDLYVGLTIDLLNQFGIPFHVPEFFLGGNEIAFVHVDFGTLAASLFWVTLAMIVVLRSNRISLEHALIAGELEAARQVQALLVPATPPVTPGFEVTSAYQPAQQVGGDFFLVLPGEDRSLLIVIGDVSGKGLRAAMVVSTIIGGLRNEPSRRPAEVLAHLNAALQGHIAGFVTCLCARITADGAMELANAGHLSPYLDGAEIALEGALPLGLAAGTEYDTMHAKLPPGSLLTFYSDGVPEAQNTAGELLGFDRARELSTEAAQAIVRAAAEFGQADDITVVTVRREA
jgi:sigma-B regulation protein RsbU (phosphoserine phosphatase)